MERVLQIKGLAYKHRDSALRLIYPDMNFGRGERVLIKGRSGVGKTTLLSLIAGIYAIQEGDICLSGLSMRQMNDKERTAMRAEKFGFVTQFPVFLPALSVLENLQFSLSITGKKTEQRTILDLLSQFGLESLLNRQVQSLSGGEKQRVAVCRALLATPQIILADEPTAHLDDDSAQKCMSILIEGALLTKSTLIVVSHDSRISSNFDQYIIL